MPDSEFIKLLPDVFMLIILPVFDEIHFTGAFQHLEPTPEEKEGHAAKRAYVSHIKRSKAEVRFSVVSPRTNSADTQADGRLRSSIPLAHYS